MRLYHMKKMVMQLETLTCPSCVAKIDGALKKLPGVNTEKTKVSFSSSKVNVEFDEKHVDVETIENSVAKLGYEVLKTRVRK